MYLDGIMCISKQDLNGLVNVIENRFLVLNLTEIAENTPDKYDITISVLKKAEFYGPDIICMPSRPARLLILASSFNMPLDYIISSLSVHQIPFQVFHDDKPYEYK